MGNYLKMAEKQRILALLELGWSYRRIQRETGVDRETVARYDPGRELKPAKVSTGPASACEPYRSIIEASVARGLSAQRIWQDLREDYTSATSMPRSNVSSVPSSGTARRWPLSWSIRRARRHRWHASPCFPKYCLVKRVKGHLLALAEAWPKSKRSRVDGKRNTKVRYMAKRPSGLLIQHIDERMHPIS